MTISARTDVGKEKQANEDAVTTATTDSVQFLLVADGMGGHAAGDVASDLASTTVCDHVVEAIEAGRRDYESILAEGVQQANDEVLSAADDDDSRSMGTTVVAAIIDQGITVVNIGDSRAYSVGESIEQITVDHSFVQTLIDEGEITPEEAKTHPQRHVLSQALGTRESVEPDLFSPVVDEYLLLCSDGLTEEVSESTITDIVHGAESIEAATEALIQEANANGGSDNISVILTDNTGE